MERLEVDITIITIFRNEKNHIEATIDSIKDQDYVNYECLMVDGGSDDNSAEIVLQMTKGDPRFKLVSQLSLGISNAFNEGLQLSDGKYIVFLNGGDQFSSEKSLSIMMSHTIENPDAIHSFRSEYIEITGEPTGKYFPKKTPDQNKLAWYCSLSHQGSLIPRKFFSRYGGFLPVLKVAMDYELWLRALSNKYPIKGYSNVVAYHRIGGISFQNINQSRKELILCRLLHLGFFRTSLIKDFCQALIILFGKMRVQ